VNYNVERARIIYFIPASSGREILEHSTKQASKQTQTRRFREAATHTRIKAARAGCKAPAASGVDEYKPLSTLLFSLSSPFTSRTAQQP